MTRAFAVNFLAVVAGAAVAVALLFAPAARADTVYKSIGPDGEVTYGSQPEPGARESIAIDIPSLSPEQRRAALLLRRHEKALSAEVNSRLRTLEREWRRVDLEIVAARNELAQAESALQKGRTPLPGERRGKAGGGSRLSEAYFQRLQQSEVRVEEAKQRLDRAYAARKAYR